MATLDLTPYEPVDGTTSDANAVTAAFQAIDSVVNALDDTNIAVGANIGLAKLSSGGATDGQAMVYSQSAGRWQPSNIGNVLAHDTTLVDLVSSTTETDLFGTANTGISIPGGTLGSTKTIRVSLVGDLLNNTGANSHGVTLKLYYGSGQSIGGQLNSNSSANHILLRGEFFLEAVGATNTQAASGAYRCVNGNEVSLPAPNATKGWTDLTVDSSAAQNLRLTATLDLNSASLEFRKRYVIVEAI